MSDTSVVLRATDVYAELDRLTDELNTMDLTGSTRDELLDALRTHEAHARRMTYIGYRLINEARDRRLPDEFGCPSMGRFLRPLLRLDPREAAARDRAAQAAGPSRSLTGEPLPAPFAYVGPAQAAGVVSERQALIIENTIDALPTRYKPSTARRSKPNWSNTPLTSIRSSWPPWLAASPRITTRTACSRATRRSSTAAASGSTPAPTAGHTSKAGCRRN